MPLLFFDSDSVLFFAQEKEAVAEVILAGGSSRIQAERGMAAV